jgi:uncharacterized BrkB/YihY/UPF0761 family membrane protein
MKRIALSIFAGLVLNFILSTAVDFALHASGVFPPYGQPMFQNGLVALAFTYRMLFIILCAWVTAIIAREQAKRAVLILGIIGSLLWLAGAIAFGEYTPTWYNMSGVVLGIPFTLAGLKIYKWKQQRATHYQRAF